MKVNTEQVLKILHVLSWIIFIGLCVEAGAFICNALLMLIHPAGAKYYWHEVNLLGLYKYDPGYFFTEMVSISIVAVLRAYLFYQIVKIFYDKKLNMSQPFNKEVGRFILRISYVSMLIGVFSWFGVEYTGWLVKQGVEMPDTQHLRLDGGDVWLFMGITLYIIAQIFKRGIEIQTENDLTV